MRSGVPLIIGVSSLQIQYMETSAKPPPTNVDNVFLEVVRLIRY